MILNISFFCQSHLIYAILELTVKYPVIELSETEENENNKESD